MTEQEEGIADCSTTVCKLSWGAKPGLGGIIFTHFVLCPQHFMLSALKKVKHFLMSTWLLPLCFFMTTPPHPLTCLALHRLSTCLSTKMFSWTFFFGNIWWKLVGCVEGCEICFVFFKNHTRLILCAAEHLIKALWNLLTLPPASAFSWKCHTRKKKEEEGGHSFQPGQLKEDVWNKAHQQTLC